MKGGIAGLSIGLILGASAAALAVPGAFTPAAALAGRYSRHFTDGLVDGTSYPADDVAEVVPVDATHAYVRFHLNFFNGHTCSLSGIAEGSGATLVYRSPPQSWNAGNICTLTIRRAGGKLAWTDGDGSCQSYCGARGGFRAGDLPWASRRPISYLPASAPRASIRTR